MFFLEDSLTKLPDLKGNIGVDESFIESFENVPKIQIYSSREVEQHMQQINDCISNLNQDWEKRVDSVCFFFRSFSSLKTN
jgi:hypothetical protein